MALKAVMVVIALFIGWTAFSVAQRYWLTAMVERVNDPAYRVELPKSSVEIPKFDPEKMKVNSDLMRGPMMQPAAPVSYGFRH